MAAVIVKFAFRSIFSLEVFVGVKSFISFIQTNPTAT